MPRYIEIEKFLDELDKQICSDCIDEDAHCCSCGVGCARGIAKDLATADVVPKSEVERLYYNLQAVLEERAEPKRELAREIFAEIENEINNELQNNFKVLPQVKFSNELWNRISGRINAFQGIYDFIAELKKKYQEGE